MYITDEIIDYVSKLSKIEFTAEQKRNQKQDIQDIVDYVEILNLLDVKESETIDTTYAMENMFRQDTIKQSSNRNDTLSNAAKKKDGYYKTVNIME